MRNTLECCSPLDSEAGDGLRLVIVEDLKIFFLEVANRSALFVADYYRHQHHIHIAFEGVGAGLSWRILSLLSCGVG